MNDTKNPLLLALQQIPLGIAVCEKQGDVFSVLHANEAFAALINKTGEDLTGRRLSDLLNDFGDCGNFKAELDHLTGNPEQTAFEFEYKQTSPSKWYKLEARPVTSADNHYLFTLKDETEEKISKAHFYQNQKLEALGQLAGGIAHDFNNIMSIIDGYARIARKEVSPGSEVDNYLDRIMQSIKRGAALTRHLLTFSRHNIVVESVSDLGAVIKDQQMLLSPLLDASIEVEVDTEEGVLIDLAEDTIAQILLNLVVNSRDAMPHGGKITIQTGTKNHDGRNHAFLSVSDTGEGMDESVQKRIFDPFYTTKEQGKGTGLGLSMVYGIVQQHKGEIDVESAPGKGTVFTILFPVSEKQPVKKIINVSGEAENVRLENYTAMIAEDEEDLLGLLANMMRDMGMNVITAINGNDALSKQEEHQGKIDFLLTDVVMPEMDGVHLANLFSSVRPDTKTVFISGYPADDISGRIHLPAGSVLLPKPIEYKNLAYILKSMAEDGNKEDQDGLQRMAGQWTSTSTH